MSAGVITHDSAEGHDAWRRFVGALCLIEFYARFVVDGCYLWNALHPGERATIQWDSVEWFPAIEHFADVLRAWAFLLLGRALWRGSRRPAGWVVLAVTMSLATLGSQIWRASAESYYFNLAPGWPRLWALLANVGYHLPWLILLAAVLLHRRTTVRRLISCHTWVIAATAWCVGRTIVDCTPLLPSPGQMFPYSGHSGLSALFRETWFPFVPPRPPRILGLVALGGPPVLALLLLMARMRGARLVALVVAAIELGVCLFNFPILAILVDSAIQNLLNAIPGPVENPFSLWRLILLTQWNFLRYAVEIPTQIAPWLLIAHYVRTQPMSPLPDDGSPWPRRYCGKCFYNLHGVESGRCPECGAELDEAGVASAEADPTPA